MRLCFCCLKTKETDKLCTYTRKKQAGKHFVLTVVLILHSEQENRRENWSERFRRSIYLLMINALWEMEK